MNRQEFLYRSACLMGAALWGCKRMGEKSPTELPVFDLHAHPGAFFFKGTPDYQGDQAFLNRVQEMKTTGFNGAFFALVADLPLLKRTETGIVTTGQFKEQEGWDFFLNQLASLQTLLAQSDTEIALTWKELEPGHSFKAFLAVEGGDFLSGKTKRVNEAYEVGIRSIQLVHYAPNDLGDLQTSSPVHRGLSRFGKEVVRTMNQQRMLIDVAHASEDTVKDVVNLSTAPVMLSHSILKDDQDRPVAARAISKDLARLVTQNGGLIGMWPSGFSKSLAEFVDHTKRMVDVVGIDHVGIGTDMDANFRPVINNYHEVNQWQRSLTNYGFTTNEVAKLAGGNSLRLLSTVL